MLFILAKTCNKHVERLQFLLPVLVIHLFHIPPGFTKHIRYNTKMFSGYFQGPHISTRHQFWRVLLLPDQGKATRQWGFKLVAKFIVLF
jgi:hypothetical protein